MRTPLLLRLHPRLLVAFLLIGLTVRSQQPRPGGTTRPAAAAREQLFITAARALPRLYEKKDFDSIAYYIQLRWQEGPTDPDLLCQSILLSIQRHIFYLTDFPDLNSLTPPVINELRIYADVLAQIQKNCPPDYHARRGYDVNDIDKQLFFTTSRWAYDLLSTRSLDSVESFLCRVYTGEIRYPDEYLSAHTAPPAPNGIFTRRPYSPRKLGGVLAVSSGIWAPEGHLSLLGVHPSFNYTLGFRNRNNEWDFDAALRFGNTPQPYIILRNDSLMSRTYYDGGNASFDYTRYLIHHTHSEIGVSGGVGVDFIDFISGNTKPDWSPTEITCFDLNFGFRYNWYFCKHGFLGLVARYHFLSYNNPGGSPFDGNAATIDIIVGLAGEYKH
jgi:hypothetical protein